MTKLVAIRQYVGLESNVLRWGVSMDGVEVSTGKEIGANLDLHEKTVNRILHRQGGMYYGNNFQHILFHTQEECTTAIDMLFAEKKERIERKEKAEAARLEMNKTFFFEFKFQLSAQELEKLVENSKFTIVSLINADKEELLEFWSEFFLVRGIDFTKFQKDSLCLNLSHDEELSDSDMQWFILLLETKM